MMSIDIIHGASSFSMTSIDLIRGQRVNGIQRHGVQVGTILTIFLISRFALFSVKICATSGCPPNAAL